MSDGRKKNNFSESRAAEFLASTPGKGLSAAAFSAASLFALRKILRTRSINKRLPKIFKDPKGEIRGLSNKDTASAAAFSGGLGALFAEPDKSTYANNLHKRLLSGGKLSKSEKKYIVGDLRPRRKKKSKTGFGDVYWSPSKWGAASAAFSGLGELASKKDGAKGFAFTPRKAGAAALLSFPTMYGEGKLRKAIQTRALSSRLSKGKDLLPAELSLLKTMRKIKAEGGK